MGFVVASRGAKLVRSVFSAQRLCAGHRTLASAANSTPRPLSCSVGFVLGGPGSGKTYQCAIAAKTMSLLHVSVGDVLREAVDPTKARPGLRRLTMAEPQLELIRDVFKSGKILPAEITIELLNQEFERRLEARVGRDAETDFFIVDGFPRTVENLEAFGPDFEFVAVINCPESVMLERLQKRALIDGRADDQSQQTIMNRIEAFKTETARTIQRLQVETPESLVEVDGEGSIEEVQERFRLAIEKFL